MTTVERPFRVLSLDGGGMRGIYTAQYLASLADGFSKKSARKTLDVGSGFDLIVGTSTGAILACALAANIPLSRVVQFYNQKGAAIFERRIPSGIGANLLADLKNRPAALRRGEQALRNALVECFAEETMVEVYNRRKIALGITAVDMSTHKSWVFKTPHLKNSNHRDDGFRLVDVCLASSAAPIYRSLAALEAKDGSPGSHVFADGGLWANNPVLVGMIDALEMAAEGQAIEIFSIGTVPRPAGDDMGKEVVYRSLAHWKFGAEAASLAIDSQEFAYDQMARMLGVAQSALLITGEHDEGNAFRADGTKLGNRKRPCRKYFQEHCFEPFVNLVQFVNEQHARPVAFERPHQRTGPKEVPPF